MVYNFTNINETNNHLSLQTIEPERPQHNGVGDPDPGVGQAQQCDGVKLVNGIPISFNNWISIFEFDLYYRIF